MTVSGDTAVRSRLDGIVDAAQRLSFADIPERAVTAATLAIADTVGCIVAGAEEPPAAVMRSVLQAEGGEPLCGVLGTSLRTSATSAALLNGTAGHALDFDDISTALSGHVSVVLVPAILALAEARNLPGQEVICSYVAGFEAGARLGRLMNPQHYDAGLHATSTLGVIGAAVASARLLGLRGAKLRAAVGIAASQSGGLRKNFGTDTKPFHAGFAARAGVFSALLAEAGATASDDILDGPIGFVRVYGGDIGRAMRTEGLELLSSGLTVKRHSSCGATHAAIDALLSLIAAERIGAGDVEAIECRSTPWALGIVSKHNPATPLEGKFSFEYCLAVTLVYGQCGPEQFTREAFEDPRVRSLVSRIVACEATELRAHGSSQADLTVALKDGRRLPVSVEHAIGTAERPMQPEDLRQKFLGCCSDVLPAGRPEQLFEAIGALKNDAPVSQIIALARTEA